MMATFIYIFVLDDRKVGYKQKFLRKEGLAYNFEPSRNLRLPFLQPSLLPSLLTTEAKEAKKSLPTSTVQTRALKANLTSQATSKLLINRSWRVNTLPVPPVPPPPTTTTTVKTAATAAAVKSRNMRPSFDHRFHTHRPQFKSNQSSCR
jgi:hypothetical protein